MISKSKFKMICFIVAAVLISACVGTGKKLYRTPSAETFGEHLRSEFKGLQDFTQFANPDGRDFQVKFVLVDFQSQFGADVFLDPRYFLFHDEWFLMRTFSGQDFPWMPHPAYGNLQSKNPSELQAALKKLPSLPQGLVRLEDRVVADHFYKASSGADRKFALGSVNFSYKPKRAHPQIYYFDMVFQDSPTAADIKKMLVRLSKTIGLQDLKWLPRSEAQRALAQTLQTQSEWQNRIISYTDLIVPGEVEVYSAHTVAGIPVYFPKGAYDPSRLTNEHIVMLDELPDDLPPVRGIITSVPQTELAHVNILARARGSLNVFLADSKLFDAIKSRGDNQQPIGLWASKEGLKTADLTVEEYQKYQKSFEKDAVSLLPIDVSKLEYVYDLKNLSKWKPEQIVRSVGGKSMGMIRLQQVKDVMLPPQTFALSVRAFREHLQAVAGSDLADALKDSRFQKDAKIRYLALEGPKKFKVLYPKESELAPYQQMMSGKETTALGKIIGAKGIKEMIENRNLDPKVEALVTQELKTRFPRIPKGQAFRFRSSADVEDIPGFVGAGLYDSYSGFFDPKNEAENEDDQKKSIARAIKKTWASYWNYRAFEERELSMIDHISGSMAVMIHPNFPESAEKANGVLTIRWKKQEWGKSFEININTNRGETAVVRPDGSIATPQIMDILFTPGKDPYFRQMKATSDGEEVLSKAQAGELSEIAARIMESWLAHLNQDLKPEHQNTQYMLDMEFKIVPANWVIDFSTGGADRFILKQARPLMKSQKLSLELMAMPIPRSLLSEATKIIRRKIDADVAWFSTVEVYDAQTGYDDAMNVQVDFKWKQNNGKRAAGTMTRILHTDFSKSGHGFMHHGPWDFSFDTKDEAATRTGIQSFQAYESGGFRIDTTDAGSLTAASKERVQTETLLEDTSVWLARLICNKTVESTPKQPGKGFPFKPKIGLPIGGEGAECGML